MLFMQAYLRSLPDPNSMTMLKHLSSIQYFQKSAASWPGNNMTISQVLSEYLNQCNKGEHVVLKSYASFAKSIVNRQCFLFNFSKIFETETNSRNGLDYYQLFRLLCSDFPKEIVVNSVRLLKGSGQQMMEGLLDSKKFLNSLYIHFIYSEYMDSMLQRVFKGNNDEGVPLIELYEWVKQEDSKNIKTNQKPSMEIILQIILNVISQRDLLQSKGLIFLNQNTVDQYIKECLDDREEDSMITYDQYTMALLLNKSHTKIVQSNLGSFQNSSAWAAQAAKVLMSKESQPQPLNTKKVKKK